MINLFTLNYSYSYYFFSFIAATKPLEVVEFLYWVEVGVSSGSTLKLC